MQFSQSKIFLSLIFLPFGFLFAQTDIQLLDPEYLIEQYNQLVAKHNALIEKTRVILTEQKNSPVKRTEQEARLKQQLNDSVAKISVLESELSKIKAEGTRTITSNQYLDDTNARLRKQLLEIKADEQELIQRIKELVSENRHLQNVEKTFGSQEKSNYSKIRNLELAKSTIQRKANDLLSENNSFSLKNKTLKTQVERLENELGNANQKISGLQIDKETRGSRLADIDAMLRSKDDLIKSLESKETTFQNDINDQRNEIVRLTGVESLINDRNAIIKSENELLKDKNRNLDINTEAFREEIASLRDLSNELKFEVARKNEQIENSNALNINQHGFEDE